jgi:hypothetical protein
MWPTGTGNTAATTIAHEMRLMTVRLGITRLLLSWSCHAITNIGAIIGVQERRVKDPIGICLGRQATIETRDPVAIL